MKKYNLAQKFLLKILFISTLFFISNIQSLANEVKVPIDGWPPFRIVEEDKKYGIDFDLLDEISKRTNYSFKYIKYPWSRSLANMKNGKVDIMSGLAKRTEREVYMQYTSIPYYTCSTVFYVHKGNKALIKTYDDLKEHLVGYVANSAYFAPFDTDTSLKKRAVTSEAQLIKMLLVGRIKVMIGTDCQVDYDIKQLGLTKKFEKADYRPNNNVDLYIAVSKKSKYISNITEINKVIEELVEEGFVKEIAKKYYE